MIFVVEGSDCTGKSTLAKNIASLIDCPVVHHGKMKCLETDMEYAGFITDLLNMSLHSHLVLDRFLLSEVVYSAVYGRIPRFSKSFYDEVFDDNYVVQILCKPPLDYMQMAFENHHREKYETFETWRQAYDIYCTYFDTSIESHSDFPFFKTSPRKWLYNYVCDTSEFTFNNEIMQAVMKEIENEKILTTSCEKPVSVSGKITVPDTEIFKFSFKPSEEELKNLAAGKKINITLRPAEKDETNANQ